MNILLITYGMFLALMVGLVYSIIRLKDLEDQIAYYQHLERLRSK